MAVPTRSEGVSIVFPSVCTIPAPPGSLTPVAYPPIAKTAQQVQVAQKTGLKSSAAASAINIQSEIQQLRGRLSGLHQQLVALPGTRPEQWQAVLTEYAVAASALYRTLEVQVQSEARHQGTVSSITQAKTSASSSIKNIK
jgi:hypothetical protein